MGSVGAGLGALPEAESSDPLERLVTTRRLCTLTCRLASMSPQPTWLVESSLSNS